MRSNQKAESKHSQNLDKNSRLGLQPGLYVQMDSQRQLGFFYHRTTFLALPAVLQTDIRVVFFIILNTEKKKKIFTPNIVSIFVLPFFFFFSTFLFLKRSSSNLFTREGKNIFKQEKTCCYSKTVSDSINSVFHCLIFPGTVGFLVDLWALFSNRGIAQGLSGRGSALIVVHLKGTVQSSGLQKDQAWTPKQQPCLP